MHRYTYFISVFILFLYFGSVQTFSFCIILPDTKIKRVLHSIPLFQLRKSVHILDYSLFLLLCYYRNIVMAYTSHYNMMLGIQVLHCFDFALLWSAMVDYVNDISPPSIRVTMNVVLHSVHYGMYSI